MQTKSVVRIRAPRKPVGEPVQKKYINRHEAAVFLGCSEKHVAALVQNGCVPEYELGLGPYTKRYTIADLDKYAQARKKFAKAGK